MIEAIGGAKRLVASLGIGGSGPATNAPALGRTADRGWRIHPRPWFVIRALRVIRGQDRGLLIFAPFAASREY